MRKTLLFLFFGMLVLAGTVLAEDPPEFPVQATGDAFQNTFWEHGNDITGGAAGEFSFSYFNAEGPCDAEGDTLNNGWSTGASNQGADSASSFSKSYNEFSSWAEGTKAEVGAEGLTNQFNEASVNKGDEFSSGWGNTSSSYENFISGTGLVTDSGKAGSNGNTAVSLTESANAEQANAMTKDSSFAIVNPNTAGGTTSAVDGAGAVGSWIQMGGAENQNFSGAAGFDGFARYNATSTGPLSGSLQSIGDSFINLGADFISAGSHNASSATINGGACGGAVVCD